MSFKRKVTAFVLISPCLFLSLANKCRPNPCQNDGRCAVDLRRMDGYHCRCTSDFAGRHCQGMKYLFDLLRTSLNVTSI